MFFLTWSIDKALAKLGRASANQPYLTLPYPSYCSKQITTSTNDFIQELEQLYALWILVFQT